MYYLKSNVIAEPLINHWYASVHLLSPSMAAMIFAYSHVKIMSSYIAAPQMHELACSHPETKGGPFIDYPTRRVDEVRDLLEKTKHVASHYLSFAENVTKLHQLLESHPRGMSLEPLYSQLADELRGFVELYYDVANRPHFRFIEKFLYDSPLNTAPLQSVLFSLVHQDYRPFCLSTPRIPTDEVAIVKPFRDTFYDQIFSSREHPLTKKDLMQLMNSVLEQSNNDSATQANFLNLFQLEKPVNKFSALEVDNSLRVRYFGHACVLIESPHCTILFDPALSYDYPSDIPRFTYSDLPEKIDYVILTHTHQDHVIFEHLLQIRYKIGCIIVPANVPGALQDPSLKIMLHDLGFSSVITLQEFDKIDIPCGYVHGLPFIGEHGDLHIQSKMIYLVQIAGTKILCAADSNNMEHRIYEKVHQITGDIDILFIGMECAGAPLSWLYQPILLTSLTREVDQSRRLNGSDFEKARLMVDTFCCKHVYIYAMGQEPWLNYIMGIHYTPTSPPIIESDKLIAYCKSKHIKATRLFGAETIQL
ncbi:MAG: MBL fold metallo-hydrolase [Legionellaceae bacterium]|nr:MBL fold metallo-hydrolase [Legionellaceae bacterium]